MSELPKLVPVTFDSLPIKTKFLVLREIELHTNGDINVYKKTDVDRAHTLGPGGFGYVDYTIMFNGTHPDCTLSGDLSQETLVVALVF